MKKISKIVAIIFTTFVAVDCYAGTYNFSNLSTYTGQTFANQNYWNGADDTGMFASSDYNLMFVNSYTHGSTAYPNDYWSGMAYSAATSVQTESGSRNGYENELISITGAPVDGSANYGICYVNSYNTAFDSGYIILDNSVVSVPERFVSISISNTALNYYSMLDGSSFYSQADKFGEGDWLMLKIIGLDSSGVQTGVKDFYLANITDGIDIASGIVSGWTDVDIGIVGVNAVALKFEMYSSKNNEYGMMTPSYFSIGSITTSTVPEPSFYAAIFGVVSAIFVARKRRISK